MSVYRHLYQGANLMNEAFLDRWRVYELPVAGGRGGSVDAHVGRPCHAADGANARRDCRRLPGGGCPRGSGERVFAPACGGGPFAGEDLAGAFSTRRLLDGADLMLRPGARDRAAGPAIYAKVSV